MIIKQQDTQNICIEKREAKVKFQASVNRNVHTVPKKNRISLHAISTKTNIEAYSRQRTCEKKGYSIHNIHDVDGKRLKMSSDDHD